MKRIFFLGITILPLLSKAQISCPSFGRQQNYEKWEILPTWNTVDPYYALGNLHFIEEDYLNQGITHNLSSAPGIIIKYYPDEITAIRLKAIYTIRDIHDRKETLDTVNQHLNIVDDQFDQTFFKIAPGFQWTYFIDRFSFFGGFEIPFTYYSDFKQTEYQVDSFLIDTVGTVTHNLQNVPGGYSIGLGFVAGSTFYYKKIFGIGFEISDAYEYSKLGGTVQYRSNVTINHNATASGFDYEEEIRAWKFSPFQASIQLSIRF